MAERKASTPRPGEVPVAARVVSLSDRDVAMAAGAYVPDQPLRPRALSDITNEVVNVGASFARWTPTGLSGAKCQLGLAG
jgi:NADPH:quinone reductase-like Zn-dependent oxidoreductase